MSMLRKFTIRMPEDEEIFYRTWRFPAGEVQIRLNSEGVERMKAADKTEIILHAVPDVMRLAQLVDAMNRVKPVLERELFLQYMPYGRADRPFTEGDGFGLDIFFRHLALMNFTSIWTFDVHNEVVTQRLAEKYGLTIANFKPTDDAVDQIEPCLVRMSTTANIPREEMALISPDEGARERYDLSKYDMKIFVGSKVRDAESGKLNGFQIDRDIVGANAALIVDDICDGGGTFIGLAKEIRKINPNIKLGLYVSHGIFSKGLKELEQHFCWIFTSDYTFHKPGQLDGTIYFVNEEEKYPGVCIR